MNKIKNGKIVLNGTLKEEDMEYMLLRCLEIIVDKEIDIYLIKHSDSVETYNDMRNEEHKLTHYQFVMVKEIVE